MRMPLTIIECELMNKVVVTYNFQIIRVIFLSIYIMCSTCFKLSYGKTVF